MLKTISTLVCSIILTLSASTQPLFREDFSNNQRNWLVNETSEYAFTMRQGWYRMQSKGGGMWFSSIPVDRTLGSDFEIKTTIRKISGTDAYYFGLIMGRNNNNGYYHFAGITGNGQAVLADKGNSPADIIRSATYAAVNRGNSTNTLMVRKTGNQFQYLVNDQLIGTTRASAFFGNYFGFQIWSGNESLTVEMDELLISAISSQTGSASFVFISDRASMNLKGSVSSVKERSVKANSTGSSISTEDINIGEYAFNSRGYFTKKSEEFTDCEPCTYKYGTDGYKLITTASESISSKMKHRFYKKGNLLVEEQYDIDTYDSEEDDYEDLELFIVIGYKLDAQGRILEQTEYFDETLKEPASRITYTYDSKGRLTETRSVEMDVKTNNAILQWRLLAQDFDEQGNPKTEMRYDGNNKLVIKAVNEYTYDAQKNWIKKFMTITDHAEGNKTQYYNTYRTIKY